MAAVRPWACIWAGNPVLLAAALCSPWKRDLLCSVKRISGTCRTVFCNSAFWSYPVWSRPSGTMGIYLDWFYIRFAIAAVFAAGIYYQCGTLCGNFFLSKRSSRYERGKRAVFVRENLWAAGTAFWKERRGRRLNRIGQSLYWKQLYAGTFDSGTRREIKLEPILFQHIISQENRKVSTAVFDQLPHGKSLSADDRAWIFSWWSCTGGGISGYFQFFTYV